MSPIIFIYINNKGSIQMRCFQIYEYISRKYKCEKICWEEQEKINNLKKSIIFFFKHINTIATVEFKRLKERKNYLIFDTIDIKNPDIYKNFNHVFYKNFDFIITPLIYLKYLNKSNKEARYIPHHYDTKLINYESNPEKVNKILFNGSISYIEKYENLLKNKVTFCLSFDNFTENLYEYSSYLYHISLYDEDIIDPRYKPITKIATAAALDSIIICENSEENLYWLGEDYPFYINNYNKEHSIRKLLKKIVKNLISEDKIKMALKKMKILKKELSLENIIDKYYVQLINDVKKLRKKDRNESQN